MNLVLALILWGVTGVASSLGKLDAAAALKNLAPGPETALVWLLLSNLFLALFNLIPAFPMDGGRMLRAVLTKIYGFQEATRMAAGIGQFLAMGLGLFGVLSGQLPPRPRRPLHLHGGVAGAGRGAGAGRPRDS